MSLYSDHHCGKDQIPSRTLQPVKIIDPHLVSSFFHNYKRVYLHATTELENRSSWTAECSLSIHVTTEFEGSIHLVEQLQTQNISVPTRSRVQYTFLEAYIRICYSNDKEVVDYVTGMVPLLCVSVSADSPIGALSGITRGGGFQKIGAYVNLGAYYLVGATIAFLLGFGLKLNAKRLWMRTLTRFVPNAVILAIVTVFTAWQKEATEARERIVEKSIEAHDGLV